MATVRAEAQTAPRSKLYIGIGVLSVVFVIVGFWQVYFAPVFFKAADKATILHVHAAVFLGYLALFTAQACFAAVRRIDLHIRVGRFGIGYGFIIILVGLTTGLVRSAGYAHNGDPVVASDLLYDALVDMGVFALFFAAAVAFRNKPELHKRLMIIALTSLLVPAVWRMPFLGQPPNQLLAHAIWLSPLVLTICADYLKHRVLNPVMLIGAFGLMVQSPMFRPSVSSTETWRSFSGWLLGL